MFVCVCDFQAAHSEVKKSLTKKKSQECKRLSLPGRGGGMRVHTPKRSGKFEYQSILSI